MKATIVTTNTLISTGRGGVKGIITKTIEIEGMEPFNTKGNDNDIKARIFKKFANVTNVVSEFRTYNTTRNY